MKKESPGRTRTFFLGDWVKPILMMSSCVSFSSCEHLHHEIIIMRLSEDVLIYWYPFDISKLRNITGVYFHQFTSFLQTKAYPLPMPREGICTLLVLHEYTIYLNYFLIGFPKEGGVINGNSEAQITSQ